MVSKIAPTCALCAMLSLLSACGTASDTPTGPSTTVVTPPAPMTGMVQGIVKHEAYVSHGLFPEGPLSGAQVVVTEGPGAGRSVTTGADGAYRFELPSGPFRIRWLAANYDPRDSDPGEVIAGTTRTVEAVVLQRGGLPEWSISGIVRDGAGNPVADALVDAWDGVAWFVAHASTDATGGFRIASTRGHPDWIHVSAWKEGYVSQSVTVQCGPSCAIVATPRLLRLVRAWLDGPSTMQVGDVAPISLRAEYDDGSRKAYITRVASSNPAVVQVLPLSQQEYDKSYVKAIAPGTAALQDNLGGPLILNVHVMP